MTEGQETFAGRRVRLGMVGGGQGAFIGAVHRIAARLDDQYEFVAGALSSEADRALASAAELGLDPERLPVGREIIIPNASGAEPVAEGNVRTYVVVDGDTWSVRCYNDTAHLWPTFGAEPSAGAMGSGFSA